MALRLRALDLFGGPDRVVDQMTRVVCDRLGRNGRFLGKPEELERYFNLPRGLLTQIQDGEQKLDIDLFEKLQGPLNLCSIYDILGQPTFNGDGSLRQSWEKERTISPMHVVAHERGQAGDPKSGEALSLEFYVTLRAIGELHKTSSRRGP